MTTRRYHLFFLPFLGLTLLNAQEKVPSNVGTVLGVPSTDPSGKTSDIRTEIESLWNAGKKEQARDMLGAWRKNDKSSPWPWVVEAKMQFDEKKYKKTISLGQKALGKSPDCGEAYYWRGRAYEKTDRLLEAANEYRAAMMAEVTHADARTALDRVLNFLDPARLSTAPSGPAAEGEAPPDKSSHVN